MDYEIEELEVTHNGRKLFLNVKIWVEYETCPAEPDVGYMREYHTMTDWGVVSYNAVDENGDDYVLLSVSEVEQFVKDMPQKEWDRIVERLGR